MLSTHHGKLTKTSMILPHNFQCIGLSPGRQICPSVWTKEQFGSPRIPVKQEQGKGEAFLTFKPGTGAAASYLSFSQLGLTHQLFSSDEAKSCLTNREAHQKKKKHPNP